MQPSFLYCWRVKYDPSTFSSETLNYFCRIKSNISIRSLKSFSFFLSFAIHEDYDCHAYQNSNQRSEAQLERFLREKMCVHDGFGGFRVFSL